MDAERSAPEAHGERRVVLRQDDLFDLRDVRV